MTAVNNHLDFVHKNILNLTARHTMKLVNINLLTLHIHLSQSPSFLRGLSRHVTQKLVIVAIRPMVILNNYILLGDLDDINEISYCIHNGLCSHVDRCVKDCSSDQRF